jgi:hypothetical protein
MKYIYFIVYFQKRGYDEGTGSIEVARNKKIKSIEELRELEKFIKKECNLNKVLIINYKLLRKEGGEE